MSKRYATVSALLGMAVGALVASPYLDRAANCAADKPAFSCALENSVGPFIGAILLGFVLGIAIGRNAQKAWQRWGPGSERGVGDGILAREPATSKSVSEPDESRAMATVNAASAAEGFPAAAEGPRSGELPRRDVSIGSRGRPRPTPRIRD